MGPLPVTMAWTKKPKLENMASRPFLISLTFSSSRVSGSSAAPQKSRKQDFTEDQRRANCVTREQESNPPRPRGSKGPPGYRLSRPSTPATQFDLNRVFLYLTKSMV